MPWVTAYDEPPTKHTKKDREKKTRFLSSNIMYASWWWCVYLLYKYSIHSPILWRPLVLLVFGFFFFFLSFFFLPNLIRFYRTSLCSMYGVHVHIIMLLFSENCLSVRLAYREHIYTVRYDAILYGGRERERKRRREKKFGKFKN